MVKHYHFDLVFGDDPRMHVNVRKSIVRRLSKLMLEIDRDAPQSVDVYSDGIVGWYWRKPPPEDAIVDVIKQLGLDFCYRFVPDGNAHVEKDCQNCFNDGPMRYGGICCPIPANCDWKIVRVN